MNKNVVGMWWKCGAKCGGHVVDMWWKCGGYVVETWWKVGEMLVNLWWGLYCVEYVGICEEMLNKIQRNP